MSIVSSAIKNKKKVICHVPSANQLENIKPIEVKCFLDDDKLTIETNNEQQKDVTATMMTIVPQPKRPINVPLKKKTVTTVTDVVSAKPIRHLAILPSSKEQSTKGLIKHGNNLSETFTRYDGPSTTPDTGRSLDETITMNDQNLMSDLNCELPMNIELKTDDTNICDNTTISSVCELVDQSKLQQKPHSLIGRYQLSNTDTSSKPNPSLHIATVYYGETQPPEAANKQALIQQFYTQLEKMKATFNTEEPHQITTNTLTFDNGEVRQTSATNQLKEKTIVTRVPSANMQQHNTKPPIPKKHTIKKKPPPPTSSSSCRIQSAPAVTMATRPKIDKKPNSTSSSCKQRRTEKKTVQQKPSVPTNEIPIRRTESAPPNRIEIHGPEVTLLPQDEQECRQMYEKLQRLQPNGVCVDMNTLRRALYPPIGTTAYSSHINHDQTSAFKSYRQRTEEMPQSWLKVDDKYISRYEPKVQSKSEIHSNESDITIASDNTNIDRIADQVKKHAAINYCYYTRTK